MTRTMGNIRSDGSSGCNATGVHADESHWECSQNEPAVKLFHQSSHLGRGRSSGKLAGTFFLVASALQR